MHQRLILLSNISANGCKGSLHKIAGRQDHCRSFASSCLVAAPSQEQEAVDKAGSSSHAKAHPLWNWPNAISMARLVSGPGIGYLILQSQWEAAFLGLGISGLSDWLDGFVARRYNQGSVIGSYLDPLADKVLIGCTVGALAHEGFLYTPLAAVIIGRDVFLVVGAFILRLRSLGNTWPGWREFFRTTGIDERPAQGYEGSSSLRGLEGEETGKPHGKLQEAAYLAKQNPPTLPASYVQPLYISKVNTVVQIFLVAGCITSASYAWPPQEVILGLGGITAGLTVASGIAYVQGHKSTGKI